jgi:protein-S-isoprenylcysteine O-methyltransferase Ste14
MKAFSGYTWRGWLTGKAIPLTFFTMLLIAGILTLPQEMALHAPEDMRFAVVLELLRRSLTLGFWLLVVASYLARTRAVVSAHGFWERVFPMLVMFAAPVGIWLLGRVDLPHRLDLAGIGLLLALLGYGVSLWSLWHLRSAFAITAEARRTVTSGPYRYVRHPLYLGETLTMLGLCLMISSAIALLFWAALATMQLTRARIEELKLAKQFEEYRAYRRRTRFILPGLY